MVVRTAERARSTQTATTGTENETRGAVRKANPASLTQTCRATPDTHTPLTPIILPGRDQHVQLRYPHILLLSSVSVLW